MLRSVAAAETGESLRLYPPDNALLFSSLDLRRPGFARAVEIARASGFESVVRLAGGHAAVFLEQSMAFAWACPDADPRSGIRARFERLSAWVVDSLRVLGLDARVGEVPGEYCPGEFSVNIGGHTKVMGVGQRVIRGGAHVGGVLTVGATAWLREILIPVYAALELDFEPATAGGVSDFAPGIEVDDVIGAFVGVLRQAGYGIEEAAFERPILDAAGGLLSRHRVAENGEDGVPGGEPTGGRPDSKTVDLARDVERH